MNLKRFKRIKVTKLEIKFKFKNNNLAEWTLLYGISNPHLDYQETHYVMS